MARLPILYDADCGFCLFMLAQVLRWDRRRRLRPVALQEPEAAALLGAIPMDERMASWHLVLPDGEVRSGGHAFAPLLEVLPGGRVLARLAGMAPGLADRAYRLVADRRATFGPWIPRASRERASRLIAERTSGTPARPRGRCPARSEPPSPR